MNTDWIYDNVKGLLFFRYDNDIIVELKEGLLLKIHTEIFTEEMISCLQACFKVMWSGKE